jgi:hypothetical protein
MMMTVVFTLLSFNPESWRGVWKAMRQFKNFPDPVQGVLLLWAILIVYAGARFLVRIVKTVLNPPDKPLPQKSRSA